ncbi:hypothetical protein B0I35DRAFT_403584 [Stachybotrys elegans]|uniref:F-box domain-containing protein n=1 Tax=Stachybotrys elegans TaxID=80388 RepID=A0A8K0WWH1_9HYPO|nr:hypothetical protein B0I35DRAFT_403584 [Stachybotrys elegans]
MTSLASFPAETLLSIAAYLGIEEYRNFRLTCHTLANASRPLLSLRSFEGLPYRDDANRLDELSRMPSCASRIREVSFNMSCVDDYTALHHLYSRLWWMEAEERTERMERERRIYSELRPRFPMSWSFPDTLIQPMLGRLFNLTSLSLTWVSCPWKPGEGLSPYFSAKTSIQSNMDAVLSKQQAFIDALDSLELPLESLTIEGMVLRSISLGTPGGSGIKSLAKLRRFRVVIKAGIGAPYPYDKLEELVLMMPLLEDLRVEVVPTPWRLEDIREFLPRAALRNLHTFLLAGHGVSEVPAVSNFVLRHAPTLKRLELSAFDNSWSSAWPAISDKFDLESFRLEKLEDLPFNPWHPREHFRFGSEKWCPPSEPPASGDE